MHWLRGYEAACTVQKQCTDTLVVSIADRDGDLHEWFLLTQEQSEKEKAEFIIRAKSNRIVIDGEKEEADEFIDGNRHLWELMDARPILGHYELRIPATPLRKERMATMAVRAGAVTFNRVRRVAGSLPSVSINAVYAQEVSPPKGEKPVDWMLLTSLTVEDYSQAQTIIGWYRCRWQIERYMVANVCALSQGHPLTGSRSVCISCNNCSSELDIP